MRLTNNNYSLFCFPCIFFILLIRRSSPDRPFEFVEYSKFAEATAVFAIVSQFSQMAGICFSNLRLFAFHVNSQNFTSHFLHQKYLQEFIEDTDMMQLTFRLMELKVRWERKSPGFEKARVFSLERLKESVGMDDQKNSLLTDADARLRQS